MKTKMIGVGKRGMMIFSSENERILGNNDGFKYNIK
jgi:hypothetical protein